MTYLTRVRLLSCVTPYMIIQMVLLNKFLPAIFALKRFSLVAQLMNGYVSSKIRPDFEGFATMCTFEFRTTMIRTVSV